MSRVNYSSEQSAQIDQLKTYVEEYCQKNGIDPKTYTNYLDGNKAVLDPSIINDPVFQAYWQLAYLQLNEIINPTPLQSLSSEVGEVDFDALYASVDSETNELIRKILEDDPQLMGLAAQMNGVSAQEILSLVNKNTPPPQSALLPNGQPANPQSVVLKNKLGMGNLWDWLENSQEGLESVEQWAVEGINDIDSYVASMDEMISTGQIKPEEAQIMLQEKLASREVYVYFMQQAQTSVNQKMEFFSSLLKALSDSKNNIVRNFNVSA